ncbi:hypothetical protein [Alteraurantiacibacter palmitatis]|uniref:Uncharacterized protein n=1 Tax=Alteraurantiacibacter palmitatis TaxID=2054628 RepID=A0ABV7E458_9SPHN
MSLLPRAASSVFLSPTSERDRQAHERSWLRHVVDHLPPPPPEAEALRARHRANEMAVLGYCSFDLLEELPERPRWR